MQDAVGGRKGSFFIVKFLFKVKKIVQTKKRQSRYLNSVFVLLLSTCLSVLNVHVGSVWAAPGAAETAKAITPTVEVSSSIVEKTKEKTGSDPAIQETSTSTTKKETGPQADKTSSNSTMLLGGLGVAAVALAAVAAGSGGSGDSSVETASTSATTTSVPPTDSTPKKESIPKEESKPKVKKPTDTNPPNSEPVGPDIRGDNWSGFLDLVGSQGEGVSASIQQNGNHVVITTSSNQEYGRKFVGTIDDSGSMRVYDQRTGELWSTHKGPAKKNRIDLYDYVHNLKALDRLYLER